MSLTEDQITAPGTYAVRFEYGELSSKRFRDAVNLVKGIGKLDDTTAAYDGDSKTWTVTLPEDSFRGLMDLRATQRAYHAIVERVGYDGPGAVLVGDTYVTPAEAAEYAAAEDEALRSLGAE